ncbi:MAG: hypothetical protein ACE5II_03870, partial [Anaerolineae bacterium]
FLYEQVVPKDHFLVKLKEIIPWQRFTYKLVKYYKGKAKEGRPPYDPALILSHRDPVGSFPYRIPREGMTACPGDDRPGAREIQVRGEPFIGGHDLSITPRRARLRE